MHKTTKKFVILFFALVTLVTSRAIQTAVAYTGSSDTSSSATTTSAPQPPTTPAWVEVSVTAGGVDIKWADAYAGDYPLDHYTVQRSSDNSTYTDVATVDSNTTEYIDAGDHVGNWYQIIANDNQNPVNAGSPTTAVQVPDQTNASTISTSNTADPIASSNAPADTTIPSADQSASQATADNTDVSQMADAQGAIASIVNQTNIDDSLRTSTSDNTSNIDSAVELTPAHPLTDPRVNDGEVNKLYADMSDTTTSTVTDVPSLASQVNEDDSHITVQTPSNRAKLLTGYSDSHIVNLLNSIVQGKKALVGPLLNRYNYEKTSLIELHNSLSTSDIKAAQAHCQTQDNILDTALFNLPNDDAYLDIQGLANCRVIQTL